jgi:hypothetical protein
MASIARGREGREIFGSLKGKRKEGTSSSTNREKARNTPIVMIIGSNGVRGRRSSLSGSLCARTSTGRRSLITEHCACCAEGVSVS